MSTHMSGCECQGCMAERTKRVIAALLAPDPWVCSDRMPNPDGTCECGHGPHVRVGNRITCDECNAVKYRRPSTMTIRAKFVLQSVTTYGGEGRELNFWAQYDTSIPEDQRFAKASPSGSMKMTIDNPAALAFFEGKIGKAFYLDMVEAPEPPKP